MPDIPDIARRLIAAFPVLRDASAALHARLAGEVRLLEVPAGTTLFDDGAPCRNFPLVLGGSVRVVKTAANGREIVLYRVGPGEACVLSSACLLGHREYSARGIAESDVELALLPQPLFDALIIECPEFRRHVFALFSGRLVDLMLLVDAVAFQQLDQRLAALLLARRPELRTTHQALASELGSVREIVSRLLNSFAEAGLVTLGREQIRVRDAAGLEQIARK